MHVPIFTQKPKESFWFFELKCLWDDISTHFMIPTFTCLHLCAKSTLVYNCFCSLLIQVSLISSSGIGLYLYFCSQKANIFANSSDSVFFSLRRWTAVWHEDFLRQAGQTARLPRAPFQPGNPRAQLLIQSCVYTVTSVWTFEHIP